MTMQRVCNRLSADGNNDHVWPPIGRHPMMRVWCQCGRMVRLQGIHAQTESTGEYQLDASARLCGCDLNAGHLCAEHTPQTATVGLLTEALEMIERDKETQRLDSLELVPPHIVAGFELDKPSIDCICIFCEKEYQVVEGGGVRIPFYCTCQGSVGMRQKTVFRKSLIKMRSAHRMDTKEPETGVGLDNQDQAHGQATEHARKVGELLASGRLPEEIGGERAGKPLANDGNSPEPMLQWFEYDHLPTSIQDRSKPFCELAQLIVKEWPRNAERTVCLRKLLEAKDAAVRSFISK